MRPSDYSSPTIPVAAATQHLALRTLRALVVLIVVAFHSTLAYLGFLGPSAFPFDEAPYQWRAFPIIDDHRWFGFDLFCASQDVGLMSLMFFLSALFTWSALSHKGCWTFLGDRLMRLGVPFVFGTTVIVPVALYPVYRLTAIDPSLGAYVRHYLGLPFWPNGPMWFLWVLLALTIAAVALHRFARRWVAALGRLLEQAPPEWSFIGLAAISSIAYVPLAIAFSPWQWSERGFFALQLSRPLFYCVYYFAGLAVGACDFCKGPLALEGRLAQRWPFWFAIAFSSLLLWMGTTSLTMGEGVSGTIVLEVIADLSFALAAAGSCFFMLAVCLRFGAVRSRVFDILSSNSLGIYLLHYVFVVWIQYFILGAAIFAIAKAAFVFTGALLLALAVTSALRLTPWGRPLVGERPWGPAAPVRRLGPRPAASGTSPANER